MKKTDAKRQGIVEKLADHLLAHGLKGASLRPLAAAAGTSDRMLLHYFVDKDELMAATLTLVAKRLLRMLNQARPEPMPFRALLPRLAGMMQNPQLRPYVRIWLELAASAAGGEESRRSVARQICDNFFDWIAAAVQVEREEDRRPLAALALATVEGCVLLEALGAGPLVACALEGVAIP